jgi:glycosyltransferase involved in cell wall biosynthesis
MDIIWFAEIKWDYLKTRKQQIIRRKPDGVRLLYLEPYVRGRDNTFDLRRDRDVLRATVPFIKTVPPGQALRWVLDRRWGRSLVDRYASSRVRRIVRQAGITPTEAGVIVSNVYAIGVAARIPGRFLCYDCNDAHADFPGMPPWTKDYFAATCRKADGVFASSQALYEDVAGLRGGEVGCELLGNGVEYGHFERVRGELGWPDPPDPPRIGYLGAIAPWFDFEFVEAVARAHPDWEIALIGPAMLGVEKAVARLTDLPNVSHGEPVSYDDVPRVLRSFTVGIIPFRRNALTRGVNPNKMYEYLAMGLPVVASNFSAEVRRYPEVVFTAEERDGFVRACQEYVSLTGDGARLDGHRRRAVEIAARHDWAVIAHRFWERVQHMGAR